tara:strand:+ start:345 stop:536 length:192 start_codon:yes stop_codon:yes gene_type:complete
MTQTSLTSIEEIKKAISTLPKQEVIKLEKDLQNYIETSMMTESAESAFLDWLDLEEDIHNNDV